jgi:serine/threonine protein kinase
MTYHVLHLRELGHGGNGDLFLAQRSDTGENVVVKYLRDSQLPHARRAFAREVRILAQKRRHVVGILFARLDQDPPYYVMPYLSGGAVTQRAGRLTEQELLTVAWEVAVALSDLHASWISHGDLKPDNVLLSQDGHLLVADPLGNGLGCTVLFSENRGGTPGYWAPEIRAGGTISRQGDVYSYGATLYHLLTGVRPVDGERLDLQVQQWSGKIAELIAACCQPNPNARPTTGEIIRMARGESWAAIQTERRQRQESLKAAITVGGIVLGVGLLVRAVRE